MRSVPRSATGWALVSATERRGGLAGALEQLQDPGADLGDAARAERQHQVARAGPGDELGGHRREVGDEGDRLGREGTASATNAPVTSGSASSRAR